MRQRACCGFGPGAPSFNTDEPHTHVMCDDGIERLIWSDGTETDLWGYRSGARDSLASVYGAAGRALLETGLRE